MKVFFRWCCFCCALAGGGAKASAASWALSGSLGVHDPSIIKEGSTWWVFSTGPGLGVKSSADGLNWVQARPIFAAELPWWRKAVPAMSNLDVWAPDVHWFNGRFWCYYCISEFGTNLSAIGLTSCSSLALGDWRDDGMVIASSPGSQPYNTIDPDLGLDADGNPWLVFGSYFAGIQLTRIDPVSMMPTGPVTPLAARSNGIEGANLIYHHGYYYLFASIDQCCQGVNSTYKIAVGRAAGITGPYLDRAGAAMSSGASTVLDAGDSRWKGPGGQSVIQNGNRWIVAFHAYDALNNGAPTLQISDLYWDSTDWPSFTAPMAAPLFQTQPLSCRPDLGSTSTLTVSAVGAATYQWSKAGAPVPGATGATLLIPATGPADEGTYDCTASNAFGSAVSNSATLSLALGTSPGHLSNLSCRASAGTGPGALAVGFVAGGSGASGTLPLLIRAAGPALAQFGVGGVLPDPSLQLIAGGATAPLSANLGWAGSPAIVAAASVLGAFAWSDPASLDSALLLPVSPGPYSAVVSGASGDTGAALAEIYDASAGNRTPATPRLINLSARSFAGTGPAALTAGFVIAGDSALTVLIRASGPALLAFGVPAVLPDPELQLWSLGGPTGNVLLGHQVGWDASPALVAVANSVGAFAWGPAGGNDSALLLTLPPGQYSAQVLGAARDTGFALIEVYEIP